MNDMAMEWTIRFPFVEAFCDSCKTKFLIEFVRPTISVKHCGKLTQLPEKIWESYCDIKEQKKTNRPFAPEPGKQPPTPDELAKHPSVYKVRSI